MLCTDPYVTVDPRSARRSTRCSSEADILVVGAPHEAYRSLQPAQDVVDIWNVLGRGVTV